MQVGLDAELTEGLIYAAACVVLVIVILIVISIGSDRSRSRLRSGTRVQPESPRRQPAEAARRY